MSCPCCEKECTWYNILFENISWYPRPVCVRFVVDRVETGQFFLLAVQFYPITIVPPLPHAHSFTTDSVQSQPMTASLSNSIKKRLGVRIHCSPSSVKWWVNVFFQYRELGLQQLEEEACLQIPSGDAKLRDDPQQCIAWDGEAIWCHDTTQRHQRSIVVFLSSLRFKPTLLTDEL